MRLSVHLLMGHLGCFHYYDYCMFTHLFKSGQEEEGVPESFV